VAWVNEEGSRFLPGMTGSASYVGHIELTDIQDNLDADGIRCGDAIQSLLDATPVLLMRESLRDIGGYVELHIEQGPVLESEGIPIGVVSAVQGYRVFEVTVRGRTAHAGTTPHNMRKDAMRGAISVIAALSEEFDDPDGGITRFTVGRISALPGSPSTVADEVTFTIDLRHPKKAFLDQAVDTVVQLAEQYAFPCKAESLLIEVLEPAQFDEHITGTIQQVADDLGYESHPMLSGAGHDAALLSTRYAAGMIFIPSHKGISHHPDENSSDADLIAGASVLADVLGQLASPSPEKR
jgi:N-carbamoyl-L-amino-acid hydrolase